MCMLTNFLLIDKSLIILAHAMIKSKVGIKSRLTIVSREAKKKQAVRDEQVSYLHVAPL